VAFDAIALDVRGVRAVRREEARFRLVGSGISRRIRAAEVVAMRRNARGDLVESGIRAGLAHIVWRGFQFAKRNVLLAYSSGRLGHRREQLTVEVQDLLGGCLLHVLERLRAFSPNSFASILTALRLLTLWPDRQAEVDDLYDQGERKQLHLRLHTAPAVHPP
jgi:hypothetical protein